jgi:excisionase family DNA binding protein
MTQNGQHPLRFYSVETVAEMLQVDASTVRRWIYRGQLPAYKFAAEGGPNDTVRIAHDDLVQFIQSSRLQPKEESTHE